MEEKIHFRNDPVALAKEFAHRYTEIRPDWKESAEYGDSSKIFQEGVLKLKPTQQILWDMRVAGRVPYISVVVSEAITDPDFERPERWNEQPELVRSVLRIAVSMDLGDWRGVDIHRSRGGRVIKSKETRALEEFLEKLEEKATLPLGELLIR